MKHFYQISEHFLRATEFYIEELFEREEWRMHIREAIVTDKVKWVNISEDIYSSINDIFNRNFSLDTWIQSQKGEKEYAILNWDGPLPSFVFFVHSLLFTFPNILIKKVK